jgi:energy-converting hydrogenase Eha subunit B
MTGTQAKLVGGALATIIVWVWGRYAADANGIPGEVGTAVGVLLVALVDLTLGGKPET